MGSYHVYRLDDDLNPLDELKNVRSISINRDATGEDTLIETASIEFDAVSFDWSGGWYRIDYTGDERVMLGCFRFDITSKTFNHSIATIQADGYSVLKPAEETMLENGSYARAGVNIGEYVASLLDVCPSSIEVFDTQLLKETIVFDSDTSRLEAAWKVLDASDWCIQLTGDGKIQIKPLPSYYALELNTSMFGEIEPEISVDDQIGYTRKYNNAARVFDLVKVSIPRYGLDGIYRVLTQDIDAETSLKIQETIGTLDRKSDDKD